MRAGMLPRPPPRSRTSAYPPGIRRSLPGRSETIWLFPITPGDGHSHLYLIQSKDAKDREELSKMLTSLVPGSIDWHARMKVTENRTATMRGQAATVVISDGVNSDGQSYRQVTA